MNKWSEPSHRHHLAVTLTRGLPPPIVTCTPIDTLPASRPAMRVRVTAASPDDPDDLMTS